MQKEGKISWKGNIMSEITYRVGQSRFTIINNNRIYVKVDYRVITFRRQCILIEIYVYIIHRVKIMTLFSHITVCLRERESRERGREGSGRDKMKKTL